MRPFFVYMLRCRDGSYYVGHTDDLERRMLEHDHGTYGGHTARRRPVELVWSIETATRDEALETELQLKGWTRAKKEALARGDWAALVRLSGPRTGPDLRRPFVLRQAQHERTSGSAAPRDTSASPGPEGRPAAISERSTGRVADLLATSDDDA